MRNLAPNYNSFHYSVRIPADVNDFDLTPESSSLPVHTGRAIEMTYLLLKFRLYDIGSRILKCRTNILHKPLGAWAVSEL